MELTSEQFFPTRWVLIASIDRRVFAEHVRRLKKEFGKEIAKKCINHAIYLGNLPTNQIGKNKRTIFNCKFCNQMKAEGCTMYPSHFASRNCESGKHSHCTCPICWG